MLRNTMALPPDERLAAEIFHEINQPLQVLKASLQMAQDNAARPVPVELLIRQLERIEQIVADFHRLSADEKAPMAPLKLSAVVRDAVTTFQAIPGQKGVTLEQDVRFEVDVIGNARLLEQLLLNLLSNASNALQQRGKVKIVVTREGLTPAIYVADWGPGLPPDVKAAPFAARTGTRGAGHGLGLTVCQRIAAEHHATLSVGSANLLDQSPPPTTVFRLVFEAVTT